MGAAVLIGSCSQSCSLKRTCLLARLGGDVMMFIARMFAEIMFIARMFAERLIVIMMFVEIMLIARMFVERLHGHVPPVLAALEQDWRASLLM